MRQKKRTIIVVVSSLLACNLYAQSGMNSPYSRYGFGKLDDQSLGFNKGMAGLAYGLRDGAIINQQNPASYAKIDSITFLFDAGISLQKANFNDNGVKKNINNSSFDYVTIALRLRKNLGFSMGFMPYSTIGYELNKSYSINNDEYTTSSYVNHYSGAGGIHKVYMGLGWSPFKNFSIGMNGSYLYGDLKHRAANIFSNSNSYSTWRIYNTNLRTYMLEFGAQYTLNLSKKDALTIGAVYTPGHSIKSTANVYDLIGNITTYYTYYSGNTRIIGADDRAEASSPSFTCPNAYELPTSIGVGFAMKHNNKITYGVDYALTKWGDTKFPTIVTENGKTIYTSVSGQLSDRHKITAGFEIQPNMYSRNYLKRIKYRVGGYYATPYTKVKGLDGANEYGVSAGFGLPIQNQYNNRSIVNISAQWIQVNPKTAGMLKENYFRIAIGLTFNESWFRKWKVE